MSFKCVKFNAFESCRLIQMCFFYKFELESRFLDLKKISNNILGIYSLISFSISLQELFKVLGSKSESISKNAQGIVSKALELWPKFKKPFSKDPLLEVLEQEGFRGTDLKDLHLPT